MVIARQVLRAYIRRSAKAINAIKQAAKNNPTQPYINPKSKDWVQYIGLKKQVSENTQALLVIKRQVDLVLYGDSATREYNETASKAELRQMALDAIQRGYKNARMRDAARALKLINRIESQIEKNPKKFEVLVQKDQEEREQEASKETVTA